MNREITSSLNKIFWRNLVCFSLIRLIAIKELDIRNMSRLHRGQLPSGVEENKAMA